MRIELTELLWLEQHELSQAQLLEVSGLPASLLDELIDAGAIPALAVTPQPRFGAAALHAVHAARRLREDFVLDTEALVLVLGLLDRVNDLEAQVQTLHARLPRTR